METIYQIRRIANSIRRVIGAITFRGRAEKLVARKGCSLRGLCTRRVCASSPAGASRSRETQEMAVATNCIINQRWKGWPAFCKFFFTDYLSWTIWYSSKLSLSLANFRPIDLSHDQNDRSSSRFATQPTCARFTYGGRFRIMAEESVPRVETSRVRCQRLRPAIKFTRTWPETIAGTIRFEGSKLHVLYLQNCIDEKEKKEKD